MEEEKGGGGGGWIFNREEGDIAGERQRGIGIE